MQVSLVPLVLNSALGVGYLTVVLIFYLILFLFFYTLPSLSPFLLSSTCCRDLSAAVVTEPDSTFLICAKLSKK